MLGAALLISAALNLLLVGAVLAWARSARVRGQVAVYWRSEGGDASRAAGTADPGLTPIPTPRAPIAPRREAAELLELPVPPASRRGGVDLPGVGPPREPCQTCGTPFPADRTVRACTLCGAVRGGP